MRDCARVKERLIEFIEGSLNDSEKAEFQAHLDGCPECRSLYARFKAAYGIAGSRQEISPPPSFYARLQERIDRYENGKVSLVEIWQYFTGRTRTVLASAAVLGAIFAGYMLGSGATIQSYAAESSNQTSLSEYFGVDYFDISSDLAVPEIYNQLINGEAQGE